MKVLNPQYIYIYIWVITPKNEGCGFPWYWLFMAERLKHLRLVASPNAQRLHVIPGEKISIQGNIFAAFYKQGQPFPTGNTFYLEDHSPLYILSNNETTNTNKHTNWFQTWFAHRLLMFIQTFNLCHVSKHGPLSICELGCPRKLGSMGRCTKQV